MLGSNQPPIPPPLGLSAPLQHPVLTLVVIQTNVDPASERSTGCCPISAMLMEDPGL